MSTRRARTIEKDKGWKALGVLINDMKSERTNVAVGITGKSGARQHPNAKGNMTIVDLATANEFGHGNVPARPAHRENFDRNVQKYKTGLSKVVGEIVMAAVTGNETKPDGATGKRALNRLGLQVAGDVKRTIAGGVPPPNAPATIAHKGSDTPLIDTGRTRQAISHEVRRGRRV